MGVKQALFSHFPQLSIAPPHPSKLGLEGDRIGGLRALSLKQNSCVDISVTKAEEAGQQILDSVPYLLPQSCFRDVMNLTVTEYM
jgi:hypothetical protein